MAVVAEPVTVPPGAVARPGTVWLSPAAVTMGLRLSRAFHDAGWVETSDPAAADTVVWAAGADPDRPIGQRTGPADLRVALVGAANAVQLVLLSSAMVYGAWENNPVPLTEDAPLRPASDFAFARRLGALEQTADDWRVAAPGRRVAVLRPAVTLAADASGGLVRALAAGMGHRRGEHDPPTQFVHLDDVVSAVVLAAERHLDGVFNVAPDGWIAGERVRALAGAVPKVKLPRRLHEVLTELRWRFTNGPIPPGLVSYTRSPWLVANDRLKAEGWRPTVTNDEAFVEGTEQKWWTMISPKRRQELALGGLVAGILTAAVAVIVAVRRHRRSS